MFHPALSTQWHSELSIQYRWDRTAWCVGVILQCELKTLGVISLCHKMTRHMNVREPLYDVNKTLTEAFHYIIIQLSFHNPNTDIAFNIDAAVLHGVWESFSNMRDFFISYTHSPYACEGLIEQREISTPRVISYNVKWAPSELFHYNMISVPSMSPFLMAHGRHYAIEDKSFGSHVVIQ